MKSIRTTNITTSKAVIQKPPRHVILGKRKRRGNVRDADVFYDFLASFCHVVMERCSPNTEDWNKMKFGADYEHLKCPDEQFERHVEENCQLAEKYITSGRLLAFEVCMVTPTENQLIGFRITFSQMDYPECRRIRNLYERLSIILENIRTMEITENVDSIMNSCKYRPRIRLLTRVRTASKRKKDNSTAGDLKISVPIADSLPLVQNLLTFYAFM
ncbi:hypothetical protein CRE_28347 [Caenorhabditis remanei]|uniref:Uncharacterized protein n=1 Tax=Caenorhabditis remanei TaxID=31234 RepID=E3LND8_CAERE|nr:hypothetical protein CRE_28347 [Caenorhabditis remanei]